MSTLQKEFNKICEEASLVGATSIVIKDGVIKEELNYGYYDLDAKKEVNTDTIFRIASISKLEVAVAVMQLVEKGLVDLDEDISTYLGFKVRNPKYPDAKITTRMLMTHTSSINDGKDLELGDKEETGYLRVIGLDYDVMLEDLITPNGSHFVPETFKDYAPGEDFFYSNLGTGILACILEHVTGDYFFDYVKKNVFEPLNIKASFQATDFEGYPVLSTYYADHSLCRSGESFINKAIHKRPLGNNYVGPAGGLFISAKDLCTLMQCYMNHGEKILSKNTFDSMLDVNWYGNKHGEYYAKGLQFMIMDLFDNRRLYGHFGSAYCVKSFLLFNPHQKLGMVFLTNGGALKYESNGLTKTQNQLISMYLDKYWDDSLHSTFKFSPFEEYGEKDGRRIKINYLKPTRVVLSKRPFLSNETMIDAFNINTCIGKDTLSKDMLGKHMFEIISFLDNEYKYNCAIRENYPHGDVSDKNDVVFTYEFDMVRKDKNEKRESLKYNYHTHCNYCDHADCGVDEYIDTAYSQGYEIIGMSDHGPMPYSFLGIDSNVNEGYAKGHMSYNTMINSYIKDIERNQEKYKGKMEILKAVEIEYVSGHDEYYKELLTHLDYLLLGQHYSMVDGVELNTYSNITTDNVIAYAKVAVQALNTKMFKIMAHPDLFLYRYISKTKGLRMIDEEAIIASNMIIDACDKNGVIMELNVGGIGKGFNILEDGSKEFSYPRSEFWKLVKKHPNIKVVIGCDAHNPKELHSNTVRKLIDISREWGFNPINIK